MPMSDQNVTELKGGNSQDESAMLRLMRKYKADPSTHHPRTEQSVGASFAQDDSLQW